MQSQDEQFERKKGLAVFLSFIMLGMSAAYIFFASKFLNQLSNLDAQPFYLSVSMMVIPGLIAAPIFITSIYIMLRRHFGHLPQQHFSVWVKISLALLVVAFVVRIAMGFWLPDFITANGFTKCSDLANPSAFASQIWVRQQDYCHPLSYLVNGEVLDWFDEQQAAGLKPTNDEVHAHIEKLIAHYKQRYQ